MTALWHILWPGWRQLLAQIFGGLWTLPVLVPAQLFFMHLWSKRKFLALHERVDGLERENKALRKQAVERRVRGDAYKGW